MSSQPRVRPHWPEALGVLGVPAMGVAWNIMKLVVGELHQRVRILLCSLIRKEQLMERF